MVAEAPLQAAQRALVLVAGDDLLEVARTPKRHVVVLGQLEQQILVDQLVRLTALRVEEYELLGRERRADRRRDIPAHLHVEVGHVRHVAERQRGPQVAQAGQIELVGFLNHAEVVEAYFAEVGLMETGHSERGDAEKALHGRVVVLPRDRVYYGRAELGEAFQTYVAA